MIFKIIPKEIRAVVTSECRAYFDPATRAIALCLGLNGDGAILWSLEAFLAPNTNAKKTKLDMYPVVLPLRKLQPSDTLHASIVCTYEAITGVFSLQSLSFRRAINTGIKGLLSASLSRSGETR